MYTGLGGWLLKTDLSDGPPPNSEVQPVISALQEEKHKQHLRGGGRGDYARLGRGARFTLEGSKSALFGWSQTTSP